MTIRFPNLVASKALGLQYAFRVISLPPIQRLMLISRSRLFVLEAGSICG